MKLKKWGALLLALCMIFTMLPTVALAASGPDAKEVIENDLIVQLPSLDKLVDTPAYDWLAVKAEPTWDDGTILDVVKVTQEFYDSTGEKMADTDTFQNNSRYTMKMTFQSFESYHGDYYYVLSGKNNVYVQYMNGTGEREPMKVTVNKDENGNPVITATYSFSIGTPPEEPSQEATYEWVLSRWDDSANTPLDKVTAVIGQPIQYRAQVIETRPDGTKSPVSTEQMDLQWGYTYVTTDIDITVTTYSTGYIFTITGNKPLERPDGLILYTENVGPDPCVEACFDFEVVEPTEIELDNVYNISDQAGQYLYYLYQPPKDQTGNYIGYRLWVENASGQVKGSILGNHPTYYTTDSDPISFYVQPASDNARFELVKIKRIKNMELLSVPDSVIKDIQENGSAATLKGLEFKVTYTEGGTQTYLYDGEGIKWTPDGRSYSCFYDEETNEIEIYSFDDVDSLYTESFKVSEQAENKVNITEGLSEVTGDLSKTEYDTVEKIESKLTETILSNEGYSADNTVLYDIEFVTNEDGGETWTPVTAENFPAEGIEVTLPYPEGTNGTEYDFTVVHMFDEDVNGHKAGEVETPEVTESANSISFRLTGTSPVMLGYKPHTHSYGGWTDCKDGSNHQRTCSCGHVQKEAHVWDEGKVTKEAAKDAEGIKTYTCKTCGATKTESIPKLTSGTTPSTPGDSANPNTDTTSPKTGDSANIALWIIVMLVSAAGLSCTYFVRRKNKI